MIRLVDILNEMARIPNKFTINAKPEYYPEEYEDLFVDVKKIGSTKSMKYEPAVYRDWATPIGDYYSFTYDENKTAYVVKLKKGKGIRDRWHVIHNLKDNVFSKKEVNGHSTVEDTVKSFMLKRVKKNAN